MAPASTAAIELATAHPVSLWQWMPSRAEVAAEDIARRRRPPGRDMPPLVSYSATTCTGLHRRPHGLERVGAVRGIPVEEVLGVEEDAPPLALEEGDGVADHLEVLGEGRAYARSTCPGVRLRDQGHDIGAGVDEGADQGVVGRAAAAARLVAPNAARVAL